MPKDRKKYFQDYYSRNRDKKIRYQTDYYHKTKEFAKGNLELLRLFEPEEFDKKTKAYREYQRAYREKKREERKKGLK